MEVLFFRAAGSMEAPVSICSNILIKAPLTPLALCAQGESAGMRSSRSKSMKISFSSGCGSNIRQGPSIGKVPPARVERATTRFEVCYSVH
jgi:hypothetical protein